MKKLITGFIFAAFLISVPLIVEAGGGNCRLLLHQQWNRIQNEQKKQSQSFEALESQAAGSVGASESNGRKNKRKRLTHIYCSHCGQRLAEAANYCGHCGQPVHQ